MVQELDRQEKWRQQELKKELKEIRMGVRVVMILYDVASC
jgi:hypothetical protein